MYTLTLGGIMLGISNTYTVNLIFLDYSPKSHVISFKVKIQPAINGFLRGLFQKRIQKKYPFIKLNGETLKIDFNETRAREFIKDIQMKNGSVAIQINWR